MGPSTDLGIEEPDGRQTETSKKTTQHRRVASTVQVPLEGEGEGENNGGGWMATDNPEQFEIQKLRKETMEEGAKL